MLSICWKLCISSSHPCWTMIKFNAEPVQLRSFPRSSAVVNSFSMPRDVEGAALAGSLCDNLWILLVTLARLPASSGIFGWKNQVGGLFSLYLLYKAGPKLCAHCLIISLCLLLLHKCSISKGTVCVGHLKEEHRVSNSNLEPMGSPNSSGIASKATLNCLRAPQMACELRNYLISCACPH